MNYLAFTFEVKSLPHALLDAPTAIQILMAQLGEIGFESFTEEPEGFIAYIPESDWQPNRLQEVGLLQSEELKVNYSQEIIEQVNWNSEWEKHFEPIVVDNQISVRAPFHDNPNLAYDIVIEPKMSFGTGHHETTHLMLKHLLTLDLENKSVLDMGCGTGILAIFSEMRLANPIDAIDIDEWCFENTEENVKRNNCVHIKAFQGDASLLKQQKYQVIIANINRNILLQDIPTYAKCLSDKGVLLLSGFYQEDIPIIQDKLRENNIEIDQKLVKNNWVALKCVN